MNYDFKIDRIQDPNKSWWAKRFGDKQYVTTLMKVFVPAVLQALISIIVLYIDNFALAILVPDKIEATAAKDALGLANPVINFGIYVTIGWISGMTIMMSQFFGNKDTKMTRQTTAYRIWSVVVIITPIVAILLALPGKLIEISSGVNTGLEYELGKIYLWVSAWTFFPYVIAEALSFSLQETKRAGMSFLAAAIGMCTNVILDPILIIVSKDVQEAVALVAMSTGIARIVQTIFVIVYILYKKDKWCWCFSKIDWQMKWSDLYKVTKKGFPVFINETCFGLFAMILVMCLLNFNTNIHSASTNLVVMIEITNVIWPGMGTAAAVLVGSELGKGDIRQAKQNANILIAWGILFSTIMISLIFIASLFVNPILSPGASNDINVLAMHMQWVMLPIIWSQGIFSVAYYSIRSGGTRIVLLCDSGIMALWTIIMSALTFTHTLDNMDPLVFLVCLESNQIAKMFISLFVYKYYHWARNLTHDHDKPINEDPETYVYENIAL